MGWVGWVGWDGMASALRGRSREDGVGTVSRRNEEGG